MNGHSPLRIAIVGFGPRGFGCLERLAIEVATRGPAIRHLVVTGHDPCSHPGAGPAYALDQPSSILLNFSARHVNLWSEDNRLLPPVDRPDFLGWLERFHPSWASGDAFAPRWLLGAYLRDCREALLGALPPTLHFRPVRGEVTDLERTSRGWTIRHADPTLDLHDVEQVMVATGHGTWSRDAGFHDWNRGLPAAPRTRRIPAVYPVHKRLTADMVPDGSVVGVRGFALSWIDATIALTEERGGTFENLDGMVPRYRDPAGPDLTIVPFSRSGLPMLAKPGSGLVRRAIELTDVWEPLRRGIREASDLTPGDLLARLQHAAVRALAALGEPPANTPPPRDPLEAMRRSVQVALGHRPPDDRWALGEAWRQAYPAVVSRASDGGVAATYPKEFSRLARTLERYAFGPPAENVARMVALASAGRLNLEVVRAPRIVASGERLVLESAGAAISLDVLLNAVTPPPGVHEDTPLILQLVRRGFALRSSGWNGLVISRSAACIGDDGLPTPGLSVVGRATEGWVLGNDTLSRILHDHTRQWAARILTDTQAVVPSGRPATGSAFQP